MTATDAHTPGQAAHADLERNIVAFCRALRAQGLLISTAEIIDALRAAQTVDVADRLDLKLGLRTVLTARPEDLPVFDVVFETFWRSQPMEGGDDHFTTRQATGRESGPEHPRENTTADANTAEDERTERPEGAEPHQSPIEVLARRDFGHVAADELEAMRRALQVIARRVALRRSRRFRATRRGQAIDARRTFRRNVKYGGTIIEIAHRRRKRHRTRLVLLCDVSRSMETYAAFLLQFIYALQHTLGRVESFVFSTRLTRVTDYFRDTRIDRALERVACEVPDWGGGTRIGDSLRTFNRHWALKVIDRQTVVLILSDGLDSGPAAELAQEMEQVASRAARMIWLNPLLGQPGYRPVARTMRAALSHVDLFASAHDLHSLEMFSREL